MKVVLNVVIEIFSDENGLLDYLSKMQHIRESW